MEHLFSIFLNRSQIAKVHVQAHVPKKKVNALQSQTAYKWPFLSTLQYATPLKTAQDKQLYKGIIGVVESNNGCACLLLQPCTTPA